VRGRRNRGIGVVSVCGVAVLLRGGGLVFVAALRQQEEEQGVKNPFIRFNYVRLGSLRTRQSSAHGWPTVPRLAETSVSRECDGMALPKRPTTVAAELVTIVAFL